MEPVFVEGNIRADCPDCGVPSTFEYRNPDEGGAEFGSVILNKQPPGFRVYVPKVGLNYTTWYDELGWGTEGARRATGVPQQGAEKGRYHECCDRQEPTC
jgi:hypothetical protein